MARVKRGNVLKNRHKKMLKLARGFRGSKSTLFIAANQALIQSWRNAYRDRRKRKRDFRSLWITRINAVCRNNGLPYSRFIDGLNKAQILMNRKALSELAIKDPMAFNGLIAMAKKALEEADKQRKATAAAAK